MLRTNILRDANGNVIGFVDTEDNGNKVLRDRNGNILGFYQTLFDMTRDANGNTVGFGDILLTLLR